MSTDKLVISGGAPSVPFASAFEYLIDIGQRSLVLDVMRQRGLKYREHMVDERTLEALAAALQDLDGFVFTTGIGENSMGSRARIAERLEWLGVPLDLVENARSATDIPPGQPNSGRRRADRRRTHDRTAHVGAVVEQTCRYVDGYHLVD